MRLSDAEVIEFINIHHLTVEVVDFVDHQHNRLAASSEHISYFCIGIYKALTDVSDEDDDICGINGDLRLVSHLGENDIFGFRLNTAGVYQRKFVVQPLHVGINTVTGYTRCILYNGNLVTCQCIKQGGFTHVRPAHNCYNRLAHTLFSFCVSSPGFPPQRLSPGRCPAHR